MFYITMDDSTGKTLPIDPSNRVYQSNQALYWSSNENIFDVLDPTLTLEKGKAGSLEFTILPTHTLYNKKIDRLRTIFRVYQLWKKSNGKWSDPIELFKGRVTEITLDMDQKKKIICEGDLAYLKDSLQPPIVRTDKNKISPKQRLNEIISNHTKSATGGIYLNKSKWNGEEKKFYIGINQLPDFDSQKKAILHTFKTTSYQSTDDAISSLISSYGGWIRTRHKAWIHGTGSLSGTVHEERYLDYLRNTQRSGSEGNANSSYSGQKSLKYGVNIVSLEVEWTSDDYFNTLLPTGDSKNQSKGSTALPLTIESVHNSRVLTIGEVTGKYKDADNTIYDHGSYYNAIGRFTRVVKTENFSGVKTASELYEKAKEYLLQNYKEDPDTYTITAIDMIELDQETLGSFTRPTEPIYIGDYVHLVSEPHGIDIYKECTAITYDLTDPAKTEFTLGEEIQKISDQFKDEKSSSGGSSKKKKTDTTLPTEQGNETQQLVSKVQEKANGAGNWLHDNLGIDLPKDEDGNYTIAGMKVGDVAAGLVSGDGLTSLASGLFGGIDVSKYIKDGKLDFSSMLGGDNGILKGILGGENGKAGMLTNLLVGDNNNGILNNLLTGTNGALNDYLKVSGNGAPNKYPEIVVNSKTGIVTIGGSWVDSPQSFNIADTKLYQNMMTAMVVSAEDIIVARQNDGGDNTYPDFKKDGNVYLPVEVKVQQNKNTIFVKDNILINAKTYIPTLLYNSSEDKKGLYAVTGLNWNDGADAEYFQDVKIPEEVYVPNIRFSNGRVYAETFYPAPLGNNKTLIGQSSVAITVSNFTVGNAFIDRSSGEEIKAFNLGYQISGDASFKSQVLSIPSSWYTPSTLNVDIQTVNANTKRVKAVATISDGNTILYTGESSSVDIAVSSQTSQNVDQVYLGPLTGNNGIKTQSVGSGLYEILLPVKVHPDDSNGVYHVGIPTIITNVKYDNDGSNVLSFESLSGDYRTGIKASSSATAYIYDKNYFKKQISINSSNTAIFSIEAGGSLSWNSKSYSGKLKQKSKELYMPFILKSKASIGDQTEYITREVDYQVPWWLLVMRPSQSKIKGKTVNYSYNSSTHKYTVELSIRDSSKTFNYATKSITTGTEAYEAGLTAGVVTGKNEKISITSTLKRTSTYTNDPDHSKAIILDSTYLYSKSTGTYEFSIGGIWFYFNVGNNPRQHGGGTNNYVEKGIQQQ